MKSVSKGIYLLVAMVLVVASVAGCKGGANLSEIEPTSPVTGTEAVVSESAPAIPEKTTGIVTETTIRMNVSGSPELDPAVGNQASSSQAYANLYDTLIYTPADGTIQPRLAESWQPNENGQSYTFKLREGVKFHDGSEVTAEDVKFSMERFITIGEGYSYVFKDVVDSVEAPSKYEVVFNLKYAMGAFPSSLVRLFILNKDLVMEHIDPSGPYGEFGDYGKAWLLFHDAGSGAYMATELSQQEFFHADRFEDWYMGWESRPNAPTAFRMLAVVEPSTIRTMMGTRELEISDPWQSTENLEAMSKIEGVSIGKQATFLEQNMYLNTTKPPLDDVNFRRAILSLLDYQSIVDNILIGSVVSTGPVPAGVTGQVSCNNLPTYDIEKAKEYVAQSKYADNYQDYPIELMVNTDVADMEKIGLLFQAAAAEVGITVEISKAPWVTIVDRMATAETTPHMFSANSAPAYNDAGTYLEARYSSKNNGSWEQGEWLGDSNLDKMIQDAIATVDADQRNEMYAAIQNYICDDVSATGFLHDLTERLAYQSSYVSWPAMENAEGGILRTLYGFNIIFADMEIFPEKKP
jgi:peptide/nickel transport system substrate-binding protein